MELFRLVKMSSDWHFVRDLILPSVVLMEINVVRGPSATQECVLLNIDHEFDLDNIIVAAMLVGKMNHGLKSCVYTHLKTI